MDGHVLLLVLAAALLHATWNSIVKGGSNKLFESSMNALGGGLGALLILPFSIKIFSSCPSCPHRRRNPGVCWLFPVVST